MAEPQTNLLEVLRRYMSPGTVPLGTVFPVRLDAPNLPDKGAREHALRRFCEFVSLLPFMRTMDGPAQPFQVPRAQIHINQPSAEPGAPGGVLLPTIAFLTSTANETTTGFLGPDQIDDDTADVYAPDSAVFWVSDHVEDLMLEVVAATDSVRRAIVEGIKAAMHMSDDAGCLRLNLPDYFDQDAEFLLLESTYVEDQDSVRNRKKAQLKINLYVPEVLLANAVDMKIFATVQTRVTTGTADDAST